MKIFDCFCYFNEDLLLELRLETLWNVVDHFVISEAAYTHAGKDRELQFDLSKFSKYTQKIRYVPLYDRPNGSNDFWRNENFIRNNIINGICDASDEDLILISDLDEIPNPSAISKYDCKYLRGDFDQRYFSYFLNNYWIGDLDRENELIPNSNTWRGSKITKYEYFRDFFQLNATSVRSYKSSGFFRSLKRAWFNKFDVQLLKNGGWHFTWILNMADIIKKIESTAHQEFNTSKYKNPAYIKAMIEGGRDFHKPHSRYQPIPLSYNFFPSYLVDNSEKFQKFLLPVD